MFNKCQLLLLSPSNSNTVRLGNTFPPLSMVQGQSGGRKGMGSWMVMAPVRVAVELLPSRRGGQAACGLSGPASLHKSSVASAVGIAAIPEVRGGHNPESRTGHNGQASCCWQGSDRYDSPTCQKQHGHLPRDRRIPTPGCSVGVS